MAAVSGTVKSSSTLPAAGFSMKAIPGRPSAPPRDQGQEPEAPNPAARRAPPPPLSTRTAPTRRRRPPGPRGPSAAGSRLRRCQHPPPCEPPPPRGVLAPPRLSSLPGTALPSSSRSRRRPGTLSTGLQPRRHFTLGLHLHRSSDLNILSPAIQEPAGADSQTKPMLGFSH